MFRFLLSVVAMLALTAAFASPSKGDETQTVTVIPDTPHDDVVVAENEQPTKSEAQYGVLHAEERVVKLPQDQNKFYLTVMGDKSDPKYQTILKWLDSNEQLKSFKSQCHFNPISTDKQIFAERYEKTVPALPCIRVQQADGKTLFQASGKNVPMSAEALAKGMSTECLFRWRRRHVNPSPEPAPNPDIDGDEESPDDEGDESQPDTIDDGGKKVAPAPLEDDHTTLVLGIVAAVLGGLALGGAHGFIAKLNDYRLSHPSK